MGFNEKVHAFIAAKFYEHLIAAFGERGERAFIHATQYYAQQRGRRMAQRAIRDGHALSFDVYQQYGEWVNTQEVKDLGCANRSEVCAYSPDLYTRITCCPWHTQFQEMGAEEAGREYCKHLDNSICRGFNPYIRYDVEQTLHESDCCIHIVRDVNFPEGASYPKKTEYLKSFAYHCGHSYWAYNEVCGAIFGAAGEDINNAVLREFCDSYGDEMADILVSYRHTNFNICD